MKNIFFCIQFLFISCLALANCSNKKNIRNNDSLIFYKFPKEVSLNLKSEIKLRNAFIRQISANPTSLVLTNMHNDATYNFILYNIFEKKIQKEFINKGTNENEAIAPLSSGLLDKQTVWFHDIALGKMVTFNLNQKNNDTLEYFSQKIPSIYYSSLLANKNTVYAYSEVKSQGKIQQIDLPSISEKDLFGSFENKPKDFSVGAWKNANQGFIYTKPSKDKLVFPLLYMDMFYILNLKNQKTFIVKGPHQHKLNINVTTIEGRGAITTSKETKLAYINAYCTNKYIYLLYTSSYHMQPTSEMGNEIYVFDWNGNPVLSLKLSNSISSFAVTEDDKNIYTFDPTSQELMSGTLNF